MSLLLSFLISSVLGVVSSQGPIGHNVVIDISHWQRNVNFSLVKADGILGVMHKATQGLSYVDNKYEQRKPEAIEAGLKWGAYHFADGTDGAKQALHFLQVVGNDPDTLLALDIEENPGGSTVNLKIAEDFVQVIKESTNRYPLVYGSGFLRNLVNRTDSILIKCPLWKAEWGPTSPQYISPWKTWTMWQYTDGQHGVEPHAVSGIGNLDRDTINDKLYPDIDSMWTSAGVP